MTKEQLIELIQTQIPDGSLVNLRISKAEMFDIVGVDDDSQVGLWNLILRPLDITEDYYVSAIKNAYMWKENGLKSEINWK